MVAPAGPAIPHRTRAWRLWFSQGLYYQHAPCCTHTMLHSHSWPPAHLPPRLQGWKLVTLLRLSPIAPWNVLNYALSVTAVPLVPYFIASSLAVSQQRLVGWAHVFWWARHDVRAPGAGLGRAPVRCGAVRCSVLCCSHCVAALIPSTSSGGAADQEAGSHPAPLHPWPCACPCRRTCAVCRIMSPHITAAPPPCLPAACRSCPICCCLCTLAAWPATWPISSRGRRGWAPAQQ